MINNFSSIYRSSIILREFDKPNLIFSNSVYTVLKKKEESKKYLEIN